MYRKLPTTKLYTYVDEQTTMEEHGSGVGIMGSLI